jgi:hypothetical protein
MKDLNKIFLIICAVLLLIGCQKMDRPPLGEYETDSEITPATPLRFYLPFDSTTQTHSQLKFRYADSISSRPCFFPDASITSVPGINGLGVNNTDGNYLSYLNSNDFVKSTSISVAFWMKHDGVPANDAQFIFSVPSNSGYWANAAMFIILDHTGAGATKDSAVIKFLIADKKGDKWFELVKNDAGDTRMPRIYDNQWHHLAFTYDETASNMNIYKDGGLHATINWAGHGPLAIADGSVTGFRLGGKTTDWGKSYIGALDQFRLYNKALSAAEVKELYDNKK